MEAKKIAWTARTKASRMERNFLLKANIMGGGGGGVNIGGLCCTIFSKFFVSLLQSPLPMGQHLGN